jgi:hypothetical protein
VRIILETGKFISREIIHFLLMPFSHPPTFENHHCICGVHVDPSYGPNILDGDFQKWEDGRRMYSTSLISKTMH